MFGLNKCCKCNGIVWWGQQSSISISPIHLSCHQKYLRNYYDNEEKEKILMSEINEFEMRTGINNNLLKKDIFFL